VTWFLVVASAALALAVCLTWDARALYVRQLGQSCHETVVASGRGCFHHNRYHGDCGDCVLVATERDLERLP
jgi:hypothetical protein